MIYVNAKWLIPEKKEQIDVIVISDNGVKQRMIIPRDESNSDYKNLLLTTSLDEIEKNTEEALRIFREEKAFKDQVAAESDQRKIGEELFLAKLEAFEMDEIKNTTDKDLKRKIRKSKNKTEILVNAIIGVINERNKSK